MNRENFTINHQLGYMVGNHLVHFYLPTLSTDMIQMNEHQIIQVPEDVAKVWAEKDAQWYAIARTDEGNKLFYENRDWYKENIEKVYLKPELKIFIRDLEIIGDKEEFLRGVNLSLWNCDASHYGATDITCDKYNHHHIILRYDKEILVE